MGATVMTDTTDAAAIHALPVPDPAPDPRDAEIARLRKALREITKDTTCGVTLYYARAALARSAP